MSWRFKKKFFFVFFVTNLFLFLILLIYLNFKPAPQSCFDGQKNFGEEDIDCGGPCFPCELRKFTTLKQYESQFLVYPDKTFDVFCLIENPNQKIGLKKIKYQFLIYDRFGVLRSTTSIKETIVLPEEKRFLIVLNQPLPDFEIGKVDLKIFEPLKSDWIKIEEKKDIKVKIYNQTFLEDNERWYLSLALYNQSFFTYNDLNLIAFIYDQNNNLIGLAESKINLNEEEVKEVKMRLPKLITKPYALSLYLQLSN